MVVFLFFFLIFNFFCFQKYIYYVYVVLFGPQERVCGKFWCWTAALYFLLVLLTKLRLCAVFSSKQQAGMCQRGNHFENARNCGRLKVSYSIFPEFDILKYPKKIYCYK